MSPKSKNMGHKLHTGRSINGSMYQKLEDILKLFGVVKWQQKSIQNGSKKGVKKRPQN